MPRDVIREQAGGSVRRHGVAQLLVDVLRQQNPDREVAQFRTIASIPDAAEQAIEDAKKSGEFTPVGLRGATGRAVRSAFVNLKPHADRVAQLEAGVKSKREKAIVFGERTPEQRRDEEWVRGQLSKMDKLLVGARFLEACNKGNVTFVNAIQRAHESGMPIVQAGTYEEGLEILVKKSPSGAEIAAEEAELGLLSSVVNVTKVALQKLAERNGADWQSLEKGE
jgi:hypothetical protein